MPPSLATSLNLGLQEMHMPLSCGTQAKLLAFISLLEKWNKVYNLTAVRAPAQMLTHHIFDSLAILPWVTGPRVLDIGSGAGLPGIPLALALPGHEFVLLDASAKKTRFMIQVSAALDLRNVTVVHARVEKYQPPVKFATLLARAFASLGEIVDMAAHLCETGGEFLLMKGVYPDIELKNITPGFAVTSIEELQVPGLLGERRLVRIAVS